MQGFATGNLAQTGRAYDYGPLGQTQNGPRWAYYGVRGSLATAGVAAGTAAALMGLEAAGVTDLGETSIVWKGGEITLHKVQMQDS